MVAATLDRDLEFVPRRQGLNQFHWLKATVALLDRRVGELAALPAAPTESLLHAAVQRSVRAISSAATAALVRRR